MQILIYESSSFGGCYEYSKEIFSEYQSHEKISGCTLLLPANSDLKKNGIKCILIPDQITAKNKFFRKLHFLYRNTFNPFILFFILLKAKKQFFVIFNDFEQISAPLWAPLFKFFFKNKHTFSVILHDPDRDAYPPSKSASVFCMKKLMSLMDFAFYHGYLPDKPYYQSNPKTIYIDIPHGIYKLSQPDNLLTEQLRLLKKKNSHFISILGNIRDQKNYSLAIQALPSLPGTTLIIAGGASHSGVNINKYKETAKNLKVDDRVIWIERFLSESEMASVIIFSDIILLNYAKNFASQSGILNLIAPFRKAMIVSKSNSSLSITAKKFQLGIMVEPDNLSSLISGIRNFWDEPQKVADDWDNYLEYASWKNLVNLTVTAFKGK